MTIEVRQMLIKSTVSAGGSSGSSTPAGQGGSGIDAREAEQWREDILAECKAWFENKLNELHER